MIRTTEHDIEFIQASLFKLPNSRFTWREAPPDGSHLRSASVLVTSPPRSIFACVHAGARPDGRLYWNWGVSLEVVGLESPVVYVLGDVTPRFRDALEAAEAEVENFMRAVEEA